MPPCMLSIDRGQPHGRARHDGPNNLTLAFKHGLPAFLYQPDQLAFRHHDLTRGRPRGFQFAALDEAQNCERVHANCVGSLTDGQLD